MQRLYSMKLKMNVFVYRCVICSGLPHRLTLKSQSGDEDVDEDSEENKDRGRVVHPVQLGVFPLIVQIILHCCQKITPKQKKNNIKHKERGSTADTVSSDKNRIISRIMF